MKKLLLAAFCALAAGAACAAPSAVASWTAPVAYTDATPIVTGTAVTYNLYQGVQGAALVKVQSTIAAATVTVTAGLTAGTTQCFAVTAVVGGVESAQSNAACAAVPLPTPNAPSQITIVIH